MIDAFAAWIEDHRVLLEKHGFSVTTTRSGQEKPGIRADLESAAWQARIALWDTGECELEKIDVESGASAFEHRKVSGPNEFEQAFSRFLNELIGSESVTARVASDGIDLLVALNSGITLNLPLSLVEAEKLATDLTKACAEFRRR